MENGCLIIQNVGQASATAPDTYTVAGNATTEIKPLTNPMPKRSGMMVCNNSDTTSVLFDVAKRGSTISPGSAFLGVIAPNQTLQIEIDDGLSLFVVADNGGAATPTCTVVAREYNS
jgi:hypothetical protein